MQDTLDHLRALMDCALKARQFNEVQRLAQLAAQVQRALTNLRRYGLERS